MTAPITITVAGADDFAATIIAHAVGDLLREHGVIQVGGVSCGANPLDFDLSSYAVNVVLRDEQARAAIDNWPQLTVTLSGPTGPAKNALAGAIMNALQNRNGSVDFTDRGDLETRAEHTFTDVVRKLAGARVKITSDTAIALPSQSEADHMPPVGPLTSTVNLKRGDIVRVSKGLGGLLTVSSISDCGHFVRAGSAVWGDAFGCLDFVARPGTWMPYTGSGNPAPELDVRVKEDSGIEFTASPMMQWDNAKRASNRAVVAFMVVPDTQRAEASNVFFPGKTLNGSDVGPFPAPEAPSTRTIAPSDVRDGDQIRVSVSAAAGTTGDGAIDRNFAQRLVERIGADHVTVELISRPLAVGDKVVIPAWDEDWNDPTGVIRFIDDDGSVMVRCEDDRHRVFSRCELSHVA